MPEWVSMARRRSSGEGRALEARVLLADAHASDAFAIATTLQGYGLSVDRAATGDTALAMATHTSYDAILVSSSLQGADAEALCRRLREHGTRSTIVLVCEAAPDARELAAVGADSWIRKPVDPGALVEWLRGGRTDDHDRHGDDQSKQ